MPKVSKTVVDADLRARVFTMIENGETESFVKINDRQKGVILTDLNNVERLIRLGAIVAEEREDLTARQLLEAETRAYQDKQAEKAAKAAEKAKKAESDKKRREEAAAKKEKEEE